MNRTTLPIRSAAPRSGTRRRPPHLAAFLLALTAVLLIATPAAEAVRRTGPDGNDYEVVLHDSISYSWSAAATNAANQGAGARLAVIESEEVDLFIESLRQEALEAAGFDPFDASAPPLWIGGRQSPTANRPRDGWSWHLGGAIPTGSSAGYSNWLVDEPNDWPSAVEDHEEDFLAIGHAGQFGWNDRSAPCRGYVIRHQATWPSGNLGPIYNPANGNYYQFVLGGRPWSWEDAKRDAGRRTHNGLRGHLLVVEDAAELAFIQSRRSEALVTIGFNPSIPSTHPPLWIAGRQSSTASTPSGGWLWSGAAGSLGIGSEFTPWAPGQPDDAPGTGVEDGQEDFLAVGRAGAGWSDEAGPLVGFIVEYEEPIATQLQLRSTNYDGAGGFRHDYRSSFTRNVPMAIEAWVYRENDSRVETIVSQGFRTSFWLGFAGRKLRFYRSGGTFADSDGEVRAGAWTHIAVSYDGSFVRFYINGESAGESGLANNGTGTADDVFLGRDPGGVPYHFLGHLDEVRLWSTSRTRPEFQSKMHYELRDTPSLEAVWPRGGRDEIVSGTNGFPTGNAPQSARVGILPSDLVVPAAPFDPTFDGNVDPSGEYLGAEQVVLRYQDGPNFKDAVAHLVHTENYLYIGVEGARQPAGGDPSLDNAVSIYLDAAGSATNFSPDMFKSSVLMADGLNSFSRVQQFVIVGPTGIPNIITSWGSYDPPSYLLQARLGTERRDEVSTLPDLEFRFHRSRIGEFQHGALDRFAISHTDNGGPTGDRLTPRNTNANNSATWTAMRYYPLPGGDLPLANVQVRVVNHTTEAGIPSIPVSLNGYGTTYETVVTDSNGEASFADVPVGLDVPLTVAIDPPEGSVLNQADYGRFNIQPTLVSTASVQFPGCPGGACAYAPLTFRLTPVVPATELSRFDTDPDPGRTSEDTFPPVLLRGGTSPKRVAAPTVSAFGNNLHPWLEFYFARSSCPVDLSLCTEGIDVFRAEATFVPASGGAPARYDITVPDIPSTRYGFMRLSAHDTWSRPANNPTLVGSWKSFPDPISVGPPPYELLHGFPFINTADGHDLDDYRAAFYDQVCDPRYMVGFWAFSPIYLELTGNGECLGMVAAARRYASGALSTTAIDPNVIYGNGFRTSGGNPVIPATFDVSNPCAPSPTNVWAQIKVHQGSQFSSEFIGELLAQFRWDSSRGEWNTDMGDQLAKLSANPGRWMLCFKEGEKGHCVQPLRVEDGPLPHLKRIIVWDPNQPNTTDTVSIDLAANTYTFGGFSPAWNGTWLFVYDTEALFGGRFHVPSIDTLGAALGRFGITNLWEFFRLFVAEDAEPLVTAGDGSQTGWLADGTFLEGSAQSLVVPQFNWIPGDNPPLGHYPVAINHLMDQGAPSIELHNRGNQYKVHASHHGTMFQFFVEDAKPGATDSLECIVHNSRVIGQIFEAGREGREVEARIALCKNASEYPAAITINNLRVPESQAIGLRTRLDGAGFVFDNDTTGPLTPSFNLVAGNPAGDQPLIADTPALTLPAGAALEVKSPDGADFRNLLFAIDEDRDGTAEESFQFLSATGDFAPYVPEPEPWLDVENAGPGMVAIIHPDGLEDWTLEVSETLDKWETLDTSNLVVTTNDGLVTTYLPVQMERCFFRLARYNQ